ncbi:MAG TPA: addiction module protein [Pyrinomonadaceae bacterium]
MSATGEKVFRQVLALPIEERAQLLEHLLSAFEGPVNQQFDELWVNEAHDRLAAYDRGEIVAIEAEDVFTRAIQKK